MTFARFGPLGVVIGLAVLAAGLFLLHRLRVRHREHEVVTFERAWSMCHALTVGDELTLARCGSCHGRFLHDLLSATRPTCPCCRIRDAARAGEGRCCDAKPG